MSIHPLPVESIHEMLGHTPTMCDHNFNDFIINERILIEARTNRIQIKYSL